MVILLTDPLKNYKSAMDKHVFTESRFTNAERQQVFSKRTTKKRKSPKQLVWLPVLASAIVVLLLLIVGPFTSPEESAQPIAPPPPVVPPVEEVEEVVEPTTEEIIQQFEAPYNEIGMILHNYKLPVQGQVGGDSGTYENGYQFDTVTGFFRSRSYASGETPLPPTEGQFIGMFMATVDTIVMDRDANTTNYGSTESLESSGVKMRQHQISEYILPQLNQLRNYEQSDEALTSWLDETIARYQAVVNSATIEEYNESYETSNARMTRMAEVIHVARELE